MPAYSHSRVPRTHHNNSGARLPIRHLLEVSLLEIGQQHTADGAVADKHGVRALLLEV